MSARKYDYVATQNIEVPPGSGITAYAEGDPVTAEAVENLGIRGLVRSLDHPNAGHSHHRSPQATAADSTDQTS